MAEIEPAAVAAAMYQRDAAAQALGIVLESCDAGRARLAMAVRPDMINGHAICHGGLIFTLADTAFAYACNAGNRASVAQSCQIHFLNPARLGDRLVAQAVERVVNGRSGLYDVSVVNQDGLAIAEFRGMSRQIGGTVTDR